MSPLAARVGAMLGRHATAPLPAHERVAGWAAMPWLPSPHEWGAKGEKMRKRE